MPPRGKRSRKALGARNAKEPPVEDVSAEPQPKATASAKRGKGRARGKAKENSKMEEQPKKRKLLGV